MHKLKTFPLSFSLDLLILTDASIDREEVVRLQKLSNKMANCSVVSKNWSLADVGPQAIEEEVIIDFVHPPSIF